MEKDTKNSFLLYFEHSELVNQLTNEQAGELIKGIFEYVNTGETPNLTPFTNLVFISIRQDLDRNTEKYEQIVEKRRAAGSKGGKQKALNNIKEQSEKEDVVPNANFAKNDFSKSSYYDNDNVNDNVNVNENVNGNVNEKEISSSSSLSPSSSYFGKEFIQEEETEEDEEDLLIKNKVQNEELLPHVVTEEERRYLEKHILLNRPDVNNVKAYVDRLITNGDYKKILASKPMSAKERDEIFARINKEYEEKQLREEAERKEAERLEAENRLRRQKEWEEERKKKIQSQIPLIKDKTSAARILFEYVDEGIPDEFREFVEKYELDKPEKIRKVFFEDLRRRHNLPVTGFT